MMRRGRGLSVLAGAVLLAVTAGCGRNVYRPLSEMAPLPADTFSGPVDLPALVQGEWEEAEPQLNLYLSEGSIAPSVLSAEGFGQSSTSLIFGPMWVIPRSNVYEKTFGGYVGYSWRLTEETGIVSLDIQGMYFRFGNEPSAGLSVGSLQFTPITIGPRLFWVLPWFEMEAYVGGGLGMAFIGSANVAINPNAIRMDDGFVAYGMLGLSAPSYLSDSMRVGADFWMLFIQENVEFPAPPQPDLEIFLLRVYGELRF